MKIDQESLIWLETQLDQVQYGEIGLVFVLHAGRITKKKRILEIKEQEHLTKDKEDI